MKLFKFVRTNKYNMKYKQAYILVILIEFTLICCSQEKNKSIGLNNSFKAFLLKFDTLKLPFSIKYPTDFSLYNNAVVIEKADSVIYVPNPKFKSLDIIEVSEFFKNKYSIEESHFLALYKIQLKNSYLLLIKKENYNIEEETLFYLNILDSLGQLVDTLTIAGFRANDYFTYCEIDTSYRISIQKLKELPIENNIDLSPELETKQEYILTEDEHFKRTYFKQEKGYFIYKDDKIIRVR